MVQGEEGCVLFWLLTVAALASCLGLLALGLSDHLGLVSFLAAALILVAGAWRFETGGVSTRELTLVASLAALAAVARIPFAVLPGIQPVTFLCIVSGISFGPRIGFGVGTTAAVLSNFALGHGPWTPWQMVAWGLAGASSGWMAGMLRKGGLPAIATFGFAWGYLYGIILNIWVWTSTFYPLTVSSFLAVESLSFPFDTAHAFGTVLFTTVLGRVVLRVLDRFRARTLVAHLPADTSRG